MGIRTAEVNWKGTLREGEGTIAPGSNAFTAEYRFCSIAGDGPGTNPTELLAASLAGCLSSTLAGALATAGYDPKHICTNARAHLENTEAGWAVTRIELHTQATVPGMDEPTFRSFAQRIAQSCPIGKAVGASVEVILTAELSA